MTIENLWDLAQELQYEPDEEIFYNSFGDESDWALMVRGPLTPEEVDIHDVGLEFSEEVEEILSKLSAFFIFGNSNSGIVGYLAMIADPDYQLPSRLDPRFGRIGPGTGVEYGTAEDADQRWTTITRVAEEEEREMVANTIAEFRAEVQTAFLQLLENQIGLSPDEIDDEDEFFNRILSAKSMTFELEDDEVGIDTIEPPSWRVQNRALYYAKEIANHLDLGDLEAALEESAPQYSIQRFRVRQGPRLRFKDIEWFHAVPPPPPYEED